MTPLLKNLRVKQPELGVNTVIEVAYKCSVSTVFVLEQQQRQQKEMLTIGLEM